MKYELFINSALDMAIKSYLASKENKNSIEYQSFLVVVIRSLVLIYGEEEIINPYYLHSSAAFVKNLTQFGISDSDITSFIEDLLNYQKFEEENQKRKIKLKCPFFINIQKYLVDMFIAKRKKVIVSYKEEEEFLELLYTMHTKDVYRLSYNYLMSEDPNFIEKYYYTKLNNFDVTRFDLDKTISSNLNLEALNYVGVNLSNLKDLSSKDLLEAQKNAYEYFEVDANSPNKEEDLQRKLDFYKLHGRKLTSGNGYVDILLLMSVIATSLSILVIIIFHIL